jgi:hypothetical protein
VTATHEVLVGVLPSTHEIPESFLSRRVWNDSRNCTKKRH